MGRMGFRRWDGPLEKPLNCGGVGMGLTLEGEVDHTMCRGGGGGW